MVATLLLIARAGAMSTHATFGVVWTARKQFMNATTLRKESIVRVGAMRGQAT